VNTAREELAEMEQTLKKRQAQLLTLIDDEMLLRLERSFAPLQFQALAQDATSLEKAIGFSVTWLLMALSVEVARRDMHKVESN